MRSGNTHNEDPYEFDRMLRAARERLPEIATKTDQNSDRISLRPYNDLTYSEKLRVYLQLTDPRSMGLFLAAYLSDPANLQEQHKPRVITDSRRYSQHKMPSIGKMSKIDALLERYPQTVNALIVLDAAFFKYGSAFREYYNTNYFVYSCNKEEAESLRLAGGSLLRSFVGGISNAVTLGPFTKEFAPYYIHVLNQLGYPDGDGEPEHHREVLKHILTQTPLRETFLASRNNEYKGCPFHGIKHVWNLNLQPGPEGTLHYNGETEGGALIPTILQRIEEANAPKPAAASAPKVTAQATGRAVPRHG